ncbi:hypothetical protein [Desulfosporosinus nitroreducens]|uniref:Uncharacterized protein n=1 Tax=Desulfosporosinus nitroreducens TaxID=2018668 RepID=A0ABT8QWJ4_9FIRM|nr:hypothetical protein [Desulfosporosinus nitroreducens]MCO1603173.1 hypothetical protein [Desulfosporosinus nitroreducens]MDO0824418.1 hypothetical protein [Desulfosporosinus nitroreducens]
MKAFIKNLLLSFSPPEEAPLSEEERLLMEIEETREKMEHAWNRLDYADPEYVDIAVLELLLVETQYGILNKRYRLMLGINDNSYFLPSAAKALSSTLEKNCRNHAFYGSLLNRIENPPTKSVTPQLNSPNPYQS